MKRMVMKSVLALAACAVFGVAAAQDVKERTIKFATQNPRVIRS